MDYPFPQDREGFFSSESLVLIFQCVRLSPQKDPHPRSRRNETKGKPRKRWKEEVDRDLQVQGVRRWRELVTDRGKWKDIVRQAKATLGCSSNGRKSPKSRKAPISFGLISVNTYENLSRETKFV
jgi:hypothetical protein